MARRGLRQRYHNEYWWMRSTYDYKYVTYNSLDEIYADANRHMYPRLDDMGSHWTGGRTVHESIEYVKRGAGESEIEPAKKLAEKIDAALHDRTKEEWSPSVRGAYPMVGDYLMGLPESMREKQAHESDQAPIRIMVLLNIPASISAATAVNRATAIGALAQRMSEERPLELWVGNANCNEETRCDIGFRVKLDTSPINLSQLVAVVNPAFSRMIRLSACNAIAGRRSSPDYPIVAGGYPFTDKEYIEVVRKRFAMDAEDLIFSIGQFDDDSLIDTNPVKWINDRLAIQRNVDEGNYL